jgi:hypothetical protein
VLAPPADPTATRASRDTRNGRHTVVSIDAKLTPAFHRRRHGGRIRPFALSPERFRQPPGGASVSARTPDPHAQAFTAATALPSAFARQTLSPSCTTGAAPGLIRPELLRSALRAPLRSSGPTALEDQTTQCHPEPPLSSLVFSTTNLGALPRRDLTNLGIIRQTPERWPVPARHVGAPCRPGRVAAGGGWRSRDRRRPPRQTSSPSSSTRWRPRALAMAASSGNSSLQSRPGRERRHTARPSRRSWRRIPSNFTSTAQPPPTGTGPVRASIGATKSGSSSGAWRQSRRGRVARRESDAGWLRLRSSRALRVRWPPSRPARGAGGVG